MSSKNIYSVVLLIPCMIILGFSLMAGCAQDERSAGEAAYVYIGSEEVAELAEGETLELDLDLYVVYAVNLKAISDMSEGGFEISNIILVSGDQRISLDSWLAESVALGGNYPDYILITGAPENFGTLSESQIYELEQNMSLQVGNADTDPGFASAPYDFYWRAPLGYGQHGG